MPGAKIPILEVEKLKLTNSGRGIEFYNDGTNLLHSKSIWSGRSCSGTIYTNLSGNPKFLLAASSSGWLKVHMVSGATYGATGATYYIPVFSNVNTNLSI